MGRPYPTGAVCQATLSRLWPATACEGEEEGARRCGQKEALLKSGGLPWFFLATWLPLQGSPAHQGLATLSASPRPVAFPSGRSAPVNPGIEKGTFPSSQRLPAHQGRAQGPALRTEVAKGWLRSAGAVAALRSPRERALEREPSSPACLGKEAWSLQPPNTRGKPRACPGVLTSALIGTGALQDLWRRIDS